MGAFVLVDSAGKDIELELLDHTYSSDSMYIKTKMFGPISVISSSSDTFCRDRASNQKDSRVFIGASQEFYCTTGRQRRHMDRSKHGLMWAKKDNGSNVTQAQLRITAGT